MRILFIGCVESSYRLLEGLVKNGKEVVGVVTKEKSDFNADFADLTSLCKQTSIPNLCVQNVNDEDSISFMKSINADIAYCFGWSQLVKEEVINLFPMGMVGFHPAALPRNRGRHPLIWALALGLSETASTFFMITAEADEGDIISQESVPIAYEDDARTLYDKVMDTAVEQEIRFTEQLEIGTIHRIKQDQEDSNSWRKRGKADGEIDWRMSSRNIYNLVRSLTIPYVGAHFVYDGQEYKVWRCQEIDAVGYENIEPGKVLSVDEKNIDVKTGEGGIRLIDYDGIEINEGDYIL